MSLAAFIRNEIDSIVESWEEFARSRLPSARGLSSQALQDHAKILLFSIADDIESEQADAEQQAKSRGERPGNAPAITSSARDHAHHRFEEGFTLDEMVAEYRALRASVQRLWASRQLPQEKSGAIQLVRFNEAMDQGLSESIAGFSQRLEEARDLLLAVLGHDLRNPLGAVLGSAHFLMRIESLDSRQVKAVTRIVNSANRMREMVDALLDFTRTRLGMGLSVVPAPGNLGTVSHSVVEELRALHPDRDLQLKCTGDLDGEWDAQRVGQMVSNLASNAVQHGAPDRPVSIGVNGGDLRAVLICVHNEGPAIPEQARKGLFEPLKRTQKEAVEAHAGSSGLGLGLYIAHQIARSHGGDIAVESVDGRGTTFTVHLPRRMPEAMDQGSGRKPL